MGGPSRFLLVRIPELGAPSVSLFSSEKTGESDSCFLVRWLYMKGLFVSHWLMAAAFTALLPVTARAGAGHSMGGHNMGGHVGMAPRVSGRPVGKAPRVCPPG